VLCKELPRVTFDTALLPFSSCLPPFVFSCTPLRPFSHAPFSALSTLRRAAAPSSFIPHLTPHSHPAPSPRAVFPAPSPRNTSLTLHPPQFLAVWQLPATILKEVLEASYSRNAQVRAFLCSPARGFACLASADRALHDDSRAGAREARCETRACPPPFADPAARVASPGAGVGL
jgi:hypothetical protein